MNLALLILFKSCYLWSNSGWYPHFVVLPSCFAVTRTSLQSKVYWMLLCSKNWLHAFVGVYWHIEVLRVTYDPVNMADYSNPFKRIVITTFYQSLSFIFTNALVSKGLITTFCWIDFTRPWLRYWTLVQIFCFKSIDENMQGLYWGLRELQLQPKLSKFCVQYISQNSTAPSPKKGFGSWTFAIKAKCYAFFWIL